MESKIYCESCCKEVDKTFFCNHLKSTTHKNKIIAESGSEESIQIIKSAFKTRIVSYRIQNFNEKHSDIIDFFGSVKDKILFVIQNERLKHTTVKINICLFASYIKQKLDQNTELSDISFNTKNFVIDQTTDLEDLYTKVVEVIKTQSEEFYEKGSGWALQKVLFTEINFGKYNPMRASSYIKLPKKIALRKAVINVENSDDACFLWSIVSALYPAKANTHRISSYPHYSKVLKFKGIELPVKLGDIHKFESLNDLSINVYGIKKEQVVGPLYYTKQKTRKHINLLYIEHQERRHYCWIKNLSRLVSSQINKRDKKIWFCDGCLLYFKDLNHLEGHVKNDCNKIKTFLPSSENNILEFTNFVHSMPALFIIYCDFEALLQPISNCFPNEGESYTVNTQRHFPYSFGYYIKCSFNDSYSKFVTYRGKDCGKFFIQSLKDDLNVINDIIKNKIPMNELNENELKQFSESQVCYICRKGFTEDNYKVKDHDHTTGAYRGSAHTKCNLNYKIKRCIPIVCHNLSGYDAHFIVKELGFDNEKIDLIAQNMERYISFSKIFKINETDYIKLRFIDSYKFMASSIDKLVNNLHVSQLTEIRKNFPIAKEFDLIRKKGVLPYDYLSSFEILAQTHLPTRQEFSNKLTDSMISEDEYNHVCNVWKVFNCKTLGEYCDIYLKSDVLLLADVFENFRNTCLKTYNLDPAYYHTSPGLSWDSMLKFTEIKLELLTDINMVHFIKHGIRGGLAQCTKRYAKANNKYMIDYDINKESTYLVYLDANNLYGWSMCQSLPFGDFNWLSSEQINNFDSSNISDNSKKGHILEVDLEYCQHLHHEHSDLPFCVEHMKPIYETSKHAKLIANTYNKSKYVIHERNLKQCLQAGMKIIKIHRILEFSQKTWLKKYIDLNTELRTKASNSFEKDFYKLMNNSVFGKTIEDVDKRTDVRLITHWENIGKKIGANALISRPNFHSHSIFSENLVAIQMNKLNVTYNKPIYVGFCILDLSKTLMYDFHYQYMKPKFFKNIDLLYTDTDSFIYEIRTDDFYSDIKNDLDKFDTSDYSTNNRYGLPLINKKMLGKFKDELSGTLLIEFIGLKAKSYCLVDENDIETKKIKGIKKYIVQKEISSMDFKNCLDSNEVIIKSQYVFKSIKHELYTQLVNKLCLSNEDDKRFLIPNSYKTLPWGHKEIENYYFT